MARKQNIVKYFDAPKSNVQFSEGQKSKGLLDDYAERQNIDTKEGTIQHTPTADKHIANKKYVDDNATKWEAHTDTDFITPKNTKRVFLEDGTQAKPPLAIGSEDDGWWRDPASTALWNINGGIKKWRLISSYIDCDINGGVQIANGVSSATVPKFRFKGDTFTGLGHPANGQVCLTANQIEAFRASEDGSGNIKMDLKGALVVQRRAVATADATDPNDYYITVDTTGGAVTLTLSSADCVSGRILVVHDNGNGATNNITIATEGAETIDGGATTSITANYSVKRLISDGTNWLTV